MTWDGDIRGMGQLASRVADLASVPARASKRIARELGDLIEQEFAEGADPYGAAWEPITDATAAKRSQTSEPPLTDFARMRGDVAVKPMRGAGVSITIPHPAEDHQTGWSGPQGSGPARPILPSRQMPPLWDEAIRVAVEDEFARTA